MPEFSALLKWLLVAVCLLAAVPIARAAAHRLRPDPAAQAQPGAPEDAGDLAAILEPIRARHKIPGLAGAIVRDGRIIAIGATGVRRSGGEQPLTIHDRFHIGSCTKAMTATLLGLLVEDGTLEWTTTVGDVFADFEMDEGWRNITLEQLLHHRGGAPADLNADGLWQRLWQMADEPRESRLELVRGVLGKPPRAPGEFLYSNAGYAIAGAMAERLLNAPWEQLMRERLFVPLGMTSAGFGAPGSAEAVDQPRGHRANGRPQDPGPGADNPPAIGPGGTVHCTLQDWARFIAMHVDGAFDAAPGAPPLLQKGTLERLHTPGAGKGQPYAMGWLITERPWARGERDGDRGRVLTHAGSNTMWFAVAWLAPERKLAILIAANQGGPGAERACDEAAGALIRQGNLIESPH